MKVSELIKELEEFKDTYGDLEVGVGRINTTGERVAYYSDIAISYSKGTYLYDDYDYETIDYNTDKFCALD